MTVKQILFREITIYAAKYKDILVNFQLISYAFFLPNCCLILKQDFLHKNSIDCMLCIKLAVYSKNIFSQLFIDRAIFSF